MGREQIVISQFQGVSGSADARDLPPGVASYALNVDIVTRGGHLIGLPAHTSVQSGVTGSGFFRPVPLGDGTDAVFYTGTNVNALRGLPSVSSVTDLGAKSGSTSNGGSSDGEAVHLGLGSGSANIPQWVGFAGAALATADAHLEPPDLASSSLALGTADGDGSFIIGRKYFYAVSFTYDGSQESPLLPFASLFIAEADGNHSALSVEVTTQNTSFRVSHITLWRGEAVGDAGEPDDDYRRVETVPWTTETAYFSSDPYNVGPYFSDHAGFPSTLEHMRVNYALSAAIDGYHVIGDCYHEDIANAEFYLFRSKPYRYDTFDWSVDYLKLPFKPTALVPFAGTLFCFSDGAYCEINVAAFTASEPVFGAGVEDSTSAVVTPHGLFFCNKRNLYLHDGARLYTIGTPVLKNDVVTSVGWLDASHGSGPVALYDAGRDLAIFVFSSGSGNYAWCFHYGGTMADSLGQYAVRGSWILVDMPAGTIQGGFMAPASDATYEGGQALLNVGGDLYALFSGNPMAWTWESRSLHEGGKPVTYYYVETVGEDATIKYRENRGSLSSAISTTAQGPGFKGTVNSSPRTTAGTTWKTVQDFRLRLEGTGSQEVQEASVVARRRRDAR